MLGRPDPDTKIRVKMKHAVDSEEFTLEQHLCFVNNRDNYDLDDALKRKLHSAAERFVRQLGTDRSPYPALGKSSADTIVDRWLLAFLKWEAHPGLQRNTAAIQSLRTQLKTELSSTLDRPAEDVYKVDAAIRRYLKTANIHQYL